MICACCYTGKGFWFFAGVWGICRQCLYSLFIFTCQCVNRDEEWSASFAHRTGKSWPVAAAALHVAAAFPYIPCLGMNGQVDHELGFSPCVPSTVYCCVNCQQEFREINQESVIRTSFCAYWKVGQNHRLIKAVTEWLAMRVAIWGCQ